MELGKRTPLASRYSVALTKGAALLQPTRTLLEHWRPDELIDVFSKRVQEENLLGTATACRCRDIVRQVFAARFLKPTDRPARTLKKILEARLSARTFSELVLVYTARKDPLIHDFVCGEYWPSVRRGRTTLGKDSVLSFLAGATQDGLIPAPWSNSVSDKIARSLLGFMEDVGLLRPYRRNGKEIVAYRMTEEGAAILAWDLHEAGLSDSALCDNPDWGLFGLAREQVLECLDGLGQDRGLIVQHAGSVVRLTWFVKSMEELIDGLAR